MARVIRSVHRVSHASLVGTHKFDRSFGYCYNAFVVRGRGVVAKHAALSRLRSRVRIPSLPSWQHFIVKLPFASCENAAVFAGSESEIAGVMPSHPRLVFLALLAASGLATYVGPTAEASRWAAILRG